MGLVDTHRMLRQQATLRELINVLKLSLTIRTRVSRADAIRHLNFRPVNETLVQQVRNVEG
jgi:hypothetical protein